MKRPVLMNQYLTDFLTSQIVMVKPNAMNMEWMKGIFLHVPRKSAPLTSPAVSGSLLALIEFCYAFRSADVFVLGDKGLIKAIVPG